MNKLKVFIALALVITVLSTMFMLPAFADEATDTTAAETTTEESQQPKVGTASDEQSDDASEPVVIASNDDASAESEEPKIATNDETTVGASDETASMEDLIATNDTDDGWATLDTSDIIAIVVAVFILVAFVVALVIFVPKKTSKKQK